MRRFYIVPRSVWSEVVNIAGQMTQRFNLFHHAIGSLGIDLDDDHILLTTDFMSEWAEEQWHSHPEVARLPHPTLERSVKLADLHSDPQHAHKQFKPHHLAKLAKLGVNGSHTVWDVHKAAIKINPGVKLSNVY